MQAVPVGDWPRDQYLEQLRLQCLLVAKARHSYLLPLRDAGTVPRLPALAGPGPFSPFASVPSLSRPIPFDRKKQHNADHSAADRWRFEMGWAGLGEARQGKRAALEAAPPHIIDASAGSSRQGAEFFGRASTIPLMRPAFAAHHHPGQDAINHYS